MELIGSNMVYLKNLNFFGVKRFLEKTPDITLEDISKMTQGEVMREYRINRRVLKELREALLAHDLDFKGDRVFV